MLNELDSYSVPESKCPKCCKKLDYATGRDGCAPAEGDHTICIGCESILTYGPGMALAESTPQEVVELFMECPDLPRMLGALRALRAVKAKEQ
jgi:hypothetical protein